MTHLASTPQPIAIYTGQERAEVRQRLSENPPDILLTFMMLERLMTRQDERDR